MKSFRFQCLNPQIRNSTGSASRHFRTLFMALAFMLAATLFADKPRVIITSDVGGTESDDTRSFVRLLLYSNELDIVGLIGTNSQFGGSERGQVQVFKNIIDVYAGIRNNLLAHADGYPTANYLKNICKYGQRAIKDMDGVGDDKATDGSNLIIAELKKADPRPLWFCVWGSNSTLAQALWDLRRERNNGTLTQDKLDAIIAKIRIYDIAGQCTTGAWIAHTFPGIFYIRSTNQFQGFTRNHQENKDQPQHQGPLDMVNKDWAKEHICIGTLGAKYTFPGTIYMVEGDTPSFLHLVSKGLNDPEKPWMGSWGGRFGREMTSPAGRYSGSEDSDYLPAPMYCAAQDTVNYNSTNYTTNFTALWRWRAEYQNDFAARMRWTETSDLAAVNHHPVAVLNGDSTQDILPLNVSPGQTVKLSAAGSTDPDSDKLSFMWWQYKEAGTYNGSVTITSNTAETTQVSIPQNATSGQEIHIVLSVKDNASPYPLTSHRRIVLTVAGSPVPTTVACIGDSITEGYPTSGTGYTKNLDDILPDNYTVLNFGRSNTTALPYGLGNDPYVNKSQYTKALASKANVFVIMLGTNDVKTGNWSHRDYFKSSLQGIVDSFMKLSPAPKVYLATQVPSFNSQTIIDPVRIETYMGPRTRELANELNIQGIDTYTPFIGRSDLFKDGIHPNTSGNELLASVIQDAITAPDDHQAPSTPSGVTATAPSTTSVTLTWSASSGTPSGYEIYRGEECVKVVAAATRSFTETGLAPGIYNYQVRAFDRALNLSAKSAAVSINTKGSTPDIDPPSIPAGLSGTVSGASVTLTWNASTDNIGVTGYEVRRGSASIGKTSGTSKVDSGLSYGSTYTYSVRAFDAAGNYSNYCTSISVTIPDSPLPDTWESCDIGSVGIAGSQSLSLGEFTLSASGSDIYTNADSFGFTYKAISGDGTITARVKSIQNTHEWAKCGVMIRETLEAGSKHASMVVTPRNRVVFARRSSTNANTPGAEYKSFSSFPMWVKLQRAGDTITGSYSIDGSNWTVLKEMTITMNETVYVGLALTSHNNSRTNTAIVDSVSVTNRKHVIPDPDIEPPTVPGDLAASVSGSSVNLKWNASTDNKGVAGYEIRRSGTSIANAAGTTLLDSGLSAGATYTYSVRAFDAANNYSEYCSPISVTIANSVVPDVWSNSDVGSVGQPGSLAFSAGEFTLKASGTDIFSTADSFGYTYSTLNGDGSITARVKSLEYTNEWAKCGVMIRETLDAGSIHASVVVAPLKKVSFQRRTDTNAGAKWGINADIPSFPAWVRIKRAGNTITGYYSSNGDVWIELYSCTMTMKQQVYIGLALSSHNNSRINTAVVDNVTVSRGN